MVQLVAFFFFAATPLHVRGSFNVFSNIACVAIVLCLIYVFSLNFSNSAFSIYITCSSLCACYNLIFLRVVGWVHIFKLKVLGRFAHVLGGLGILGKFGDFAF